MKIKVGCFQAIDSMTMQDRLHEVIYNYQASYLFFTDEIEIPDALKKNEILCPYCGRKLAVLIRSRKSLLLHQASFLFLFITTLPVSLFLFDRAVYSSTGLMWLAAVLFFIFGSILTGFIAYDIKQYEFESLYKIKSREFIKTPDGNHSFNKHRTFEEGYELQLKKTYLIFRITYLAAILVFALGFYKIVVARANDFNFIFFALVAMLAVSLPLLRLMNFLYDRHWGKTIKLR